MHRFPTLTNLLTAFVATVASAIAAIPIYNPNWSEHLSIPAFVWAPIWAMSICSLDSRVVVSDAIRSSFGAGMGASCGLFTYWVASFIGDTTYKQYAISTVLLIPFAILFMACHPECKLPTSRILRWDVALICMYLVGSFGRGNSYKIAWTLVLGFSYGSVCSVACVYMFRPVFFAFEKDQGLQYALSEFRASHTRWFEGLSAYLMCPSIDHASEFQDREVEASLSLRVLLMAIKSLRQNPFRRCQEPKELVDLNHAAVNIHAQLMAIRGTITHGGYVQNNSLAVYSHLREKLGYLRISIVLALRPGFNLKACRNLGPQSNELFAALCVGYENAPHKLFPAETAEEDDKFDDGVVQLLDDELSRMVFAVDAFVRLAPLVHDFACLSHKTFRKHTFLVSVVNHWKEVLGNLFSKSAYSRIARKPYIVRGPLGQQLLAQSLIGFQMAYPEMGIIRYFGWAQIGFLICFLPTIGQAVIRGSRRFGGTIAASAIAAISGAAQVSDNAAMFTQMLIIVFAGKLASFHPLIEYGGIVFAMAWLFECTPGMALSSQDDLLNVVAYRTICMCVGVGFSFLCSFLLFPVFSTTSMISTLSQTLRVIATIAGESFEAATAPSVQPGRSSQNLYRLHSTYSQLASLCLESRAELFVTSRLGPKNSFAVRHIVAAESAFYRLANCVNSLAFTMSAHRVSAEGQARFFDRTTIASFSELKSDIQAKLELLAEMSASELAWDHRIGSVCTKLQQSGLAPSDSVCLHVMVFELIEFLSAFDAVLGALNPSQPFATRFSKSGIIKSSGVRFSIIIP